MCGQSVITFRGSHIKLMITVCKTCILLTYILLLLISSIILKILVLCICIWCVYSCAQLHNAADQIYMEPAWMMHLFASFQLSYCQTDWPTGLIDLKRSSGNTWKTSFSLDGQNLCVSHRPLCQGTWHLLKIVIQLDFAVMHLHSWLANASMTFKLCLNEHNWLPRCKVFPGHRLPILTLPTTLPSCPLLQVCTAS